LDSEHANGNQNNIEKEEKKKLVYILGSYIVLASSGDGEIWKIDGRPVVVGGWSSCNN